MSHTDGDWDVSHDGWGHIEIVDQSGRTLAKLTSVSTMHPPFEESKANAHLMASATDLLEALELFTKIIAFPKEEEHNYGMEKALNKAYEAIQKSAGEQS